MARTELWLGTGLGTRARARARGCCWLREGYRTTFFEGVEIGSDLS